MTENGNRQWYDKEVRDRHPLFVSANIELIRSDLEPMYDLTSEDCAELVREIRMVLATAARLLEEGENPWLAQTITTVVSYILEDFEPERLFNSIINELANLVAITARVASQLGDVSLAVNMVEEAWEILLDYDSDVAEFVRQIVGSISELDDYS